MSFIHAQGRALRDPRVGGRSFEEDDRVGGREPDVQGGAVVAVDDPRVLGDKPSLQRCPGSGAVGCQAAS
jgi:hypothetical protein